MSFTDQKQRIATAEDCNMPWNGNKRSFRCYLCGHRFKVGDAWRWIYSSGRGVINFLVCDSCDGDDVLDRFVAMNEEMKALRKRFWWRESL